ncbi:hypothetical protein VYU27_009683 [Nannochloropsis oceanica]
MHRPALYAIFLVGSVQAFLTPTPISHQRRLPVPSALYPDQPRRPSLLSSSISLYSSASSTSQDQQQPPSPQSQSSPPLMNYESEEGGWEYFASVPRALPHGQVLREDWLEGGPEEQQGGGHQRRRLELLNATGASVGCVVLEEERGKRLHLESLEVVGTEGGSKEGEDAMLSSRRLLFLGALERFLNKGGRIGKVTVAGTGLVGEEALALGFQPTTPAPEDPSISPILNGDLQQTLPHLRALSLTPGGSASALVLNILGRLEHDAQNFKTAADLYTQALTLHPNSSSIFQNLGGAFASQGEHQLAFASFQRAIDLNVNDRYTYFKLGIMYEQLATGKFKEAAEHALSCYAFYVDGREGGRDTDALTIYGNLLLTRLCPEEAVAVYKRALALEEGLWNVWFNLANAYLKLGLKAEAIAALQRTLALNPKVTAARHLLLSISGGGGRGEEGGEGGVQVPTDTDPAYVVELFDYYAPTYDQHMKEGLLYTAPRILRQEVRKVLNHTLFSEGALGPVTAEGSNEALTRALNKSMRILDLGCGTGLCGAWFTDYSTRMVGVDLSPKMLAQAQKKLVYDELYDRDLREWVKEEATKSPAPTYDIIVSADVLQYLGSLEEVFLSTSLLLEPRRGLFAFTLEELQADYGQAARDGGRAARGFTLGETGRFLHTRAYVERALAHAGLAVETAISYSPRVERGEPVPGFLYVVRRKRDGLV